MRYLAIDLGHKRTGFAVGDDDTGIVSPLDVVLASMGAPLLEEIRKVVAQHGPDAIVIGLPINMNGTEGEPAKEARAFGEEVHRRHGLPVYYQDERLTSYAADEQMARSGRTHKEKARRRDALAAAQILRDYLDRAH